MPVCVTYSSKFSPKSTSTSYTDSFSSELATASTHLMLELSTLLRLKTTEQRTGLSLLSSQAFSTILGVQSVLRKKGKTRS